MQYTKLAGNAFVISIVGTVLANALIRWYSYPRSEYKRTPWFRPVVMVLRPVLLLTGCGVSCRSVLSSARWLVLLGEVFGAMGIVLAIGWLLIGVGTICLMVLNIELWLPGKLSRLWRWLWEPVRPEIDYPASMSGRYSLLRGEPSN